MSNDTECENRGCGQYIWKAVAYKVVVHGTQKHYFCSQFCAQEWCVDREYQRQAGYDPDNPVRGLNG